MKKCALRGVIVFLLVVTILAAACMIIETNENSTPTLSTSTSNVATQTSSTSPSNATIVRDATLEKFVSETQKEL